MRFNHSQPIIIPVGGAPQFPTNNSHPHSNPYNGFVPPTNNSIVFGKDSLGRTVVLQNADMNTPAAYEADLQELRQRLETHNWYYHLHENLDVYTQGYHNEQAILTIVRRRGGIFETLWNTERSRHLSNVY